MMGKKMGAGIATVIMSAAVMYAMPHVKLWEGREYTPYYDIGGVLTVCDGHTGSDIVLNKVYTDAECDVLLAKDLTIAENGVNRGLKVEVPPQTKAAFISFTFNVGVGAFQRSTLLRKANSGDLYGACNEMSRWVYVKGVRIRGLENRRISERALCYEGLETNDNHNNVSLRAI